MSVFENLPPLHVHPFWPFWPGVGQLYRVPWQTFVLTKWLQMTGIEVGDTANKQKRTYLNLPHAPPTDPRDLGVSEGGFGTFRPPKVNDRNLKWDFCRDRSSSPCGRQFLRTTWALADP